MSTTLKNLNTGGVKFEDTDYSGYQPLDSGIYEAVIEAAYLDNAKSGALSVNLKLKLTIPNGKPRHYNETVYITNKKGETFYTKEGQQYNLPGFASINAMVLHLTGKTLSESETEQKMFSVYNSDAKGQVEEPKETLTALTNKTLYVCIHKNRENKKEKVNEKWINTNESQLTNSIDKFLYMHNGLLLTSAEISKNQENEKFAVSWRENWEGKTKDSFKEVASSFSSGPFEAGSASSQTINFE